MQLTPTAKYGFRIRTRSGAVVDNLLIFGKDEMDAERKLRQIYLGCEIIEARRLVIQMPRVGMVTFEEVVDLISGPTSVETSK
ncbi:MAG: hypothetical protein IPP84_14390 [Propionivibrio sp.]|uniref:hypothetical protein n=1 Tax=Propionivibrio sp. TaxID=2212460 RepID=UPI0025FBDE34|nr:hypothetical protein [Propionivibrio sp.]MBL0209082.1 hypothetical protein [Propionivibrio sp.]